MRRILKMVLLISAASVAAACSTAQFDKIGQVQPWEKGNLAKSEMVFGGDALDAKFEQHIYFSKENASGGYGVGGGGCGCN